ncbi:MAG: lycopene beta-cyclase [Ilumatobacter sp.]|jgi:lycopene beta-cyclase
MIAPMAVQVSADVVVVGDGVAGTALAWSLQRRGVDVVLVGPDLVWSATYTTWADDIDEVAELGALDIWLHRFDRIAVDVGKRRVLERPYGIIDNDRLRAAIRADVRHVRAAITSLDDVEGRIIVDATGWPSKLAEHRSIDEIQARRGSWQTAFGVVLPAAPDGRLCEPTMMDWSQPVGVVDDPVGLPTFGYSLPVSDGWLVEETVLAGPAINPADLEKRLAARLSMPVEQLRELALRTESVRIPMGAPMPARQNLSGRCAIRYGAAAGMIHPATGYSVGTSLICAGRVADEIVVQLGQGSPDQQSLASAVWPTSLRRTRRLHEYGLDVVLKMDAPALAGFFAAFFELDRSVWPAYLRVHTPPVKLARVMLAMFVRSPWSLRRQLLSGNPRAFLRAIRG